MPFVSSAYLVKKSAYQTLQKNLNLNFFHEEGLDSDMAFCRNLRDEVRPEFISAAMELSSRILDENRKIK